MAFSPTGETAALRAQGVQTELPDEATFSVKGDLQMIGVKADEIFEEEQPVPKSSIAMRISRLRIRPSAVT